MADRKPKFDVGDLVRHRASKEVALVIEITEGCVTPHKNFQVLCNLTCKRGFIGRYTLSRSFGDSLDVDEAHLELASLTP